MKQTFKNPIIFLLILSVLGFISNSCQNKEMQAKYSSISSTGNSDLAVNRVGTDYDIQIIIDNNFISDDADIEVINFNNGITELKGEMTVPEKYRSLLPNILSNSNYTSSGKIKVTGKFIVSSEGIAYINKAGEQSVMVRYDGKVGDKWTYTTTGTNSAIKGKTITRKIIAQSTTNDFDWNGMKIKVVTVEQNLPFNGFKKAIYRTNHRFGLVNLQIYLEDSSVININID